MAAPYVKRYPGGFLDLPTVTTPVDANFLNAVETALLHLLGEAPAADEVGVWSTAGSGGLVYQKITNAQIDAAAAIDKSKLAALNIVNADIAGGAAIAKSKLAALNIVNADVDAAAAIALTKLGAAIGSFSVYKGSDQTGIATGSPTKITFDTEEWDVSGWFASSTFSPTQAGLYRLNVAISPGPTSIADGVRVQLYLYKNGALHRRLAVERYAGVGDEHTYGGTCLVENDGNDTFEVYYEHNAGANRDIRGGADKTFFQGEYVGTKT